MKRFALPLAITCAAVFAAYVFDITQKLGAHPLWADQIIFWGTPIGVLVGMLATRLRYILADSALTVLTLLAYAVAYNGKTRFAASYAEDAFAGQMWFFGWNAVVIFAVATVLCAATRLTSASQTPSE